MWNFEGICKFIQQVFISTYCVSGIVLDMEDTAVNKLDKASAFVELLLGKWTVTHRECVCQLAIFFSLWRKIRQWKRLKDVIDGASELVQF